MRGVAKEEGFPTARSSPAEGTEKIERALAGGITFDRDPEQNFKLSLIEGRLWELTFS